jgi:hypothetical protein
MYFSDISHCSITLRMSLAFRLGSRCSSTQNAVKAHFDPPNTHHKQISLPRQILPIPHTTLSHRDHLRRKSPARVIKSVIFKISIKQQQQHQQQARLAQSVARETLNLKVVGSSPTSGLQFISFCCFDVVVVVVLHCVRCVCGESSAEDHNVAGLGTFLFCPSISYRSLHCYCRQDL